MKRLIIKAFCLISTIYGFSQSPDLYVEEVIGNTYYDLQSWRAVQNRLFIFDDGTMGSVWNMASDDPGLPNKGVGYSYYNGNQWNSPSWPWQSITSEWAIFPSYTAFGENGELCFSQGETGLIMSSREEKGTGDWQENYMEGSNYKHPFVVTSGPDYTVIQLLCLDPDPSFTTTPAQPDRGSIVYSRSDDGGQSWDPENMIIEGTGPEDYSGFTIGSYAWADPVNNTIAFVAGDFHTDLILMKSTDAGDSWQKTVIWEHPYPFFELGSFDSDTFYCNDGGISVALDEDGKAHVSFSLTRVYSNLQDTNWYEKEIDGVVYWNENRETFSNNINALNPYGHPDSELVEDYSLIGWSQDVNSNGELDLLDDYGTYPTPGLSTMTQIAINDYGQIIVFWSAVTETYDNGIANFRHIWGRSSPENGNFWGSFYDINDDLIFIFSENVYPVLAKKFDYDYIFTTFQEDSEPGLSGSQTSYQQNNIWFFPTFIGWNPTWVLADFKADTTIIHEEEFIQFTNLSTGFPPDMISYEWEFEGGTPEYSTSLNPQVTYSSAGIYDVKLTASIDDLTSNTLIMEDYINVLQATGINENDKCSVSIFPNPTSGDLNISISAPFDYQFRLMDHSGKMIGNPIMLKGPISKNISLKDVPKGIIFLEIISIEGNKVQKIILK